MPELDSKAVHVTGPNVRPLAELYGKRAGRFYNGTAGRELVCCPDCGQDADLSLGGDHGGSCRTVNDLKGTR
jgi:hypothetical protein